MKLAAADAVKLLRSDSDVSKSQRGAIAALIEVLAGLAWKPSRSTLKFLRESYREGVLKMYKSLSYAYKAHPEAVGSEGKGKKTSAAAIETVCRMTGLTENEFVAMQKGKLPPRWLFPPYR